MVENGISTVTYKRRKVEVKENDDMRKITLYATFVTKHFREKIVFNDIHIRHVHLQVGIGIGIENGKIIFLPEVSVLD